jgi:hypothetical protein
MRLKKEVFDQPAFAAFAEANLVLVEVDFPRHKSQDTALKEANERWLKPTRFAVFRR